MKTEPTLTVPVVAAEVFGPRLPLALSFAELLAGPGVDRGLIGPRERERLWDRHLLNCAVITEVIAENSSVIDIGSGAGLPGLVLAIRRPDLAVTLVEPMLRRTNFLDEAVVRLGLTNVTVVRARAEELAGQRRGDVVVARAVAPLDRLVNWGWPLVARGGALVAMKGERVGVEIDAARVDLRKRRVKAELMTCGSGVVESAVRLVVVRAMVNSDTSVVK